MRESKNHKELTRDCQAVSEVVGYVLMISIVVLALSAVALTVFSEGGEMDPTHTPHTNLRENINTSEDTVQIFHSGGEKIDLKYIKIILEVDGEQAEFNMSDPAVTVFDPKGNNLPSDEVFTLGDCIVIDPRNKINITRGDINFYFVHTESSQVIQKTTLWEEIRDFPDWITPHTFPDGTAYDSYTENWLDTELVDEIDEDSTSSFIPQDGVVYENFTFGIDTGELGIPESTSFTKVILKIVSTRHDNSAKKMIPEIYNGSQWTSFAPISFHGSNNYVITELDITEYVKNTTELKNLEVRISADGHASDNSGKTFWVDFVGVHLEY